MQGGRALTEPRKDSVQLAHFLCLSSVCCSSNSHRVDVGQRSRSCTFHQRVAERPFCSATSPTARILHAAAAIWLES